MKKVSFFTGFVIFLLGSIYCSYCFVVGRLPLGAQPDKYADTSGASFASGVYAISCIIISYLFFRLAVKSRQRT